MSQSAPSTLAAVDALLEIAEFSPTPDQKAEILDAYPHVREMLQRLKHDYGFSDEPAHVFVPMKF
ncbi:MAG: hypothetical protein LAT78_11510 [Roseinatronobacter sp.]|jgi:hypothetical protein|nr:hypothetical protein [Roseinatronobacter sp.]